MIPLCLEGCYTVDIGFPDSDGFFFTLMLNGSKMASKMGRKYHEIPRFSDLA